MFWVPGEKGSYFRSYLKVARTKELQERLLHAGRVMWGVWERRSQAGQGRAGQAASGDCCIFILFLPEERCAGGIPKIIVIILESCLELFNVIDYKIKGIWL